MRFFSKPHIFYAKSNILDPQIILFDEPPSQPDQYKHDHDPKEPTCETVVPATHTHRHLNLHLIRNAVANSNLLHLIAVLEFKQRICHEDCVALFSHISRNVHAISQCDRIFLHPFPILGYSHNLWRIARAYAHANY